VRTINIDDFPEPYVRAVEQMVENLRQQLKAKPKPPRRGKLPVWPGKPIGSLTREEIYEDVD
jgi:hypothetical protein